MHSQDNSLLQMPVNGSLMAFNVGKFMFLPSAQNTHEHIDNAGSNSLLESWMSHGSNYGFNYFSSDSTSRRLYRLKFELHIYR